MFQNNKTVKFIKDKIWTIRKQFIQPIEIIKYNKVICNTTPDKLLENPPLDFDMIVYNVENESTKKIDKIIFDTVSSEFEAYKICKFNFIQVELTFLDKTYKIELQNKDYNYYIKNNKLNSAFFSYYLYKHCHINHFEDLTYTFTVMDQNANFITLTEKDELVFSEYGYDLYNNEPYKEDESVEEDESSQED